VCVREIFHSFRAKSLATSSSHFMANAHTLPTSCLFNKVRNIILVQKHLKKTQIFYFIFFHFTGSQTQDNLSGF
jgi:hypothetical protein